MTFIYLIIYRMSGNLKINHQTHWLGKFVLKILKEWFCLKFLLFFQINTSSIHPVYYIYYCRCVTVMACAVGRTWDAVPRTRVFDYRYQVSKKIQVQPTFHVENFLDPLCPLCMILLSSAYFTPYMAQQPTSLVIVTNIRVIPI